MRVKLSLAVAGLALAALVLLRAAGAKPEKESADYTRETSTPYVEVLAAVQEAAKAQGFRVSGVHDVAASLHKEGFEREPYAVVEVCKAEIAYRVLQVEPRFGSLMPCPVAVYRHSGRTVVTTILPTRLMALLPVKPGVQEAAKQVDASMKAIIDAATR